MRGVWTMASDNGTRALALLDKLLAERPDKISQDFSAATRCLTAFRDELVEEWRASRGEAARERMTQANGVLSVIVGGHYPRGDVPWQHVGQARDELAMLVA